MKQVLYAKFSRERSLPFQISTLICEEDGKKWVEKHALSPESIAHVRALPEHYKDLKEQYQETDVKICECQPLSGDFDAAVLTYVEGQSLEEILSELVQKGDFTAIMEYAKKLWSVLSTQKGKTAFAPTPEFTQVFGTVEQTVQSEACSLSNLDMLFSNVLKEDDTYVITDYEWVFDFPIPISYIYYRSILLHGGLQTLPKEQLEQLYAVGGIQLEELPFYYKLEQNFQKYVTGTGAVHVLSYLYPGMKTQNFRLEHWDTSHFYYPLRVLGVKKNSNGQTEELFFQRYMGNQVKEIIEIPDAKRYCEFRIEPVDTECVLKWNCRIADDGMEWKSAKFTQNASLNHGEEYYFQEKPVFCIPNTGHISGIALDYLVYHRNDFLIRQGIDFRLENEELHRQLRRYTGTPCRRALRKLKNLLKK